MTRRWIDYPNTDAIPRKKIHLTELLQAYEERLRFLRADKNRMDKGEVWYPLPLYKYNYADGKNWGIDYPKADPAHWPPFESPDNEFRNDIIYGIRKLIHTASAPITASDLVQTGPGAWDYDYMLEALQESCIKVSQIGTDHLGYSDVLPSLLNEAIGQSDWTDPILYSKDDPTPNHPTPTHINELRAVFEYLRYFFILPYTREYREKTASTNNANYNTAWSDAVTDIQNASWGSWTTLTTQYKSRGDAQLISGTYYVQIKVREWRLTFDLDLEISDMGWNVLPPLIAKLCVFQLNDYYDDIDVYYKCLETSDTVNTHTVSSANANKSQVLIDDISSYVGGGHDSEQFTLSARNEWNTTECNLLKPNVPTDAEGESKIVDTLHRSPNWAKFTGGMIIAANAFIFLEPNWHYGTEPPPTTTPAPTTTP